MESSSNVDIDSDRLQQVKLRDGFRIGDWTVHPLEGKLVSAGGEKRIQPKSMDVLICLAENAGSVVERESLLREVWGERAPSDEPLTRCIGDLRRAFGDKPGKPEYIQTVPKRGYLLLQSATPLAVDKAPDATGADTGNPPDGQTGRKRLMAWGFSVVLVLLLATWTMTGPWKNGGKMSISPVGGRAIVVLPFVNMSSDKEQEYFSDGISEELLNLLARVRGLRVISRSSAFSYKGKDLDIPTIAAQLGVTHVLEGSVRQSGNRLRISVQLIDAGSDTQLWSETYEQQLGDIFEVQDEIAARVVEQLKVKLQGDVPRVRGGDPAAYALVLRARYLGRQFTPDALRKSVELLKQAVVIDAGYALAWTELARGYRKMAGQGLLSYEEGYTLSRSATSRALALDPGLAQAYQSLSVIARNYDRDMIAASRHLERALEMEPADTDNIFSAAAMATSLGRIELATALAEYCASRDPVSPVRNTYLGLAYLHAGRLDDALQSFHTALTLSPEYIGVRYLAGVTLLMKNEPEQALAEMRREGDEGYRLIGLAMAHYQLGDQAASNAALAELIAKYEQDAAYNIAQVFAFRNEADRAYDWLTKAKAYNDTGMVDIVAWPLFANLQSDPRWMPFLESIGKSPAQLAEIEFDVTVPD